MKFPQKLLEAEKSNLSILRKPTQIYFLRLGSVISSSLFYLYYIKLSYQRELALRDEFCENFTPNEVLEILQNVSRERKIIFIKLAKVVAEFFLILQYTQLSEKVFFLKIDNYVIGIVGLVTSITELALEQPFLKEIFKDNPILIC